MQNMFFNVLPNARVYERETNKINESAGDEAKMKRRRRKNAEI